MADFYEANLPSPPIFQSELHTLLAQEMVRTEEFLWHILLTVTPSAALHHASLVHLACD